MRIQTRLFLGTALLVLALMAVQWWLYARELQAIEGDLTRVAATVGEGILRGERVILGDGQTEGVMFMQAPGGKIDVDAMVEESFGDRVLTIDVRGREKSRPTSKEEPLVASDAAAPPANGGAEQPPRVIRREIRAPADGDADEEFAWLQVAPGGGEGDSQEGGSRTPGTWEEKAAPVWAEKVVVRVEEGTNVSERFLVLAHEDRKLKRIPIPVSPTVKRVRETMGRGAAVGGTLLLVGLCASAVMARRLTRPLRDLADGADALGRGELGVQVPVSATGEVGDLQLAFNRMSGRLGELEAERDQWQQREHLAQLGDLSRGLAHTLRNPLHTLGLVIEELADGDGERPDLAGTARAQIRRIDRWLRSFLALGAGKEAEPQEVDLAELVNDVVFESAQQGSDVQVAGPGRELRLRVVEGAVRAAVANLLENAVEASVESEPVLVTISEEGAEAVVSIADRGPGLPEQVRQRLFAPHVTTRIGGSGMGLFLARQLVVGMHGGRLEIADREGGGTVASVRLPLLPASDARGSDPL
jgi:signal transduction histidine kinase